MFPVTCARTYRVLVAGNVSVTALPVAGLKTRPPEATMVLYVEPFVLPAATHLLHVQNPRGMAEGLAAFLARHPLG